MHNDLMHLPKFLESFPYADHKIFINDSHILTDLQLSGEHDLETIR